MVEYDDLLKKLGQFGKFQRIIFLLISLCGFMAAFNNMSIVFLAAVPDHWCHVPSASHLNLSTVDLKNLTIPLEERDGEMVYSQCKKYVTNYENWTDMEAAQALEQSNNTSKIDVVKCNEWEYDRTTYKKSIVTQWDLVCDDWEWVPTAASIYMAGLMVGVIFFGWLSDWIGRRITYSFCVVTDVALVILLAFMPTYAAFAAVRFFVGMTSIGAFTCGFVAVVEMVGPDWRVFVGIVYEYFWAVGYMLVAAYAYGLRDWFHLQLALSITLVVILPTIFFLPESPRWLYSQGKSQKADVIVHKMADVNGVPLPDILDVTVKEQKRTYFWDLLRTPRMRLRTLNIFFNWFVNSFVYYGLSLNTSNLGGNDYVNFFISAGVEVPAYLACQLGLPRFGRRWPLSLTMVLGGLSLLLVIAVPKDLLWLSITLAMFGKFCISASFAIIYVFSAELFPTVIRSTGVGSGSFFARVGGIIAPYVGSLDRVWTFLPYVVFGIFSLAAGGLALALPETKGKNLPETMEDGENFGRDTATAPILSKDKAYDNNLEISNPGVIVEKL